MTDPMDASLPPPNPLDIPANLEPAVIAGFREKGHAVVRGLARAEELADARAAITAASAETAAKMPPIAARETYGKAFVQTHNIWTRDAAVKRFVFAARFAKAAAELLGVPAVRLYHDQALFKEPGGGCTPWHQDQKYWPLATEDTITMWMALEDIPAEIGSMTFASGLHRRGDLGPWIIGDESEAAFAELVAREQPPTETYGALAAGDATFHRGWTLHRAPANPTARMRPAMTIIWYADGALVDADVTGARFWDHKLWLGDTPPGQLAAGPLNPVLWPRG